ncbi:PfpI endopeptidase-like protein [Stipitochalara longipes BDJ]|nr:PfpI endopeptidase-like protein [Stipitochalara longipes BDJ]
MPPNTELRIGVFIPSEAQLLDLSPIDLFGMLSPEYLRACTLPAPIINLGTSSIIHYISMPETGPYVELTAKASLKVSKTTEDKEVQPGMLDILLIPGPNPSTIFDSRVVDFVRGHAQWQGSDGKSTDILSVCTGCVVLGQSGILKEKRASGPRGIMQKLRKDFPDTTWIDDKRWVKDGNIWTSGGITNGQEMVAEYIRENFPGPASEAALAMADVGERGIEYTKSKPRDTLWWLVLILKAFIVGNGKLKKA